MSYTYTLKETWYRMINDGIILHGIKIQCLQIEYEKKQLKV